MTMDGNKAASYVAYAFTEVAAIYPITPSSPMAEYADEWSAQGKKNLFGQRVQVTEMQSEAGAAGAVHGSLSAGALTTTYTASQGLLLMIPNMYKIAGEFLPGVMHVSARSLATHALNIFGDHSDVMSCAQTGWAMLATNNVQEVMDLGAVAHLAAIKSSIPFLHFFDGFRTSHEQQKIEVMDYADLGKLLDRTAVQKFRDHALNPDHPTVRGTNQNPDIFFQNREAANSYYEKVPDIVAGYMENISEITGRTYQPFSYHGAPDAENIIIAMGSFCDTVETVVDDLNAKGEKVGLISVHLYRPFSAKYFFQVLPITVKRIAVMDRVKTVGAPGEPLFMDVRNTFYASAMRPLIVGGRYGLGSKDTTPGEVLSVFENLAAKEPKDNFTIGINDDVTHTSLPAHAPVNMMPKGTVQCKFWGLGSDGTVGASKQAVEIIGSHTDMHVQAYFSYDSKKSGGLTVSHLRFAHEVIKAPYLINTADFISCSNAAYVENYDVLAGIKQGGTFLLNTIWSEDELAEKIPAAMKRKLAENAVAFYLIDAVDIAHEIGLGNRINMIMEAAFFKLAKVIPVVDARNYLYAAVKKAYGRKGEKIVSMNCDAIDKGFKSLVKVDVPPEWIDARDEIAAEKTEPRFIKEILRPINAAQGDALPVSAFLKNGLAGGTYPLSTSRFEKRGIAAFVPAWDKEQCIQCNRCSFVCPHAAIRPILMTEAEKTAAPTDMPIANAVGKDLKGTYFSISVSPLDCQGCGSCVEVCPAKTKALQLQPIGTQEAKTVHWDYAMTIPVKTEFANRATVKGSQFRQPLLEFSGACAGCGETPYFKLISQLFGERMLIGNATGCSSIWGAAVPSIPFCTNEQGRGPAWSNSLFEDASEFSFGMLLGTKQMREELKELMLEAQKLDVEEDLKAALGEWIENRNKGAESEIATGKLLPLIENRKEDIFKAIMAKKDFLIKKSHWVFGGDGFAYDIGYGGLDHVLASGEDINIFVYDTEVYSNTGGQSSKATPAAAIAKFAASGKKTKKKDLGKMAMSYGYVYVAQIAMGADYSQALKAIREAEAYPGPSLIIAYSCCINHGIRKGMSHAMAEMKEAVACGYWHLYRFDPQKREVGENPFTLDSKEPGAGFRDFIAGEVRYASLAQLYPDEAEQLFAKTEADAKDRYEGYRKLSE